MVRGWVDIEGSYTTLSHLSIDGSNTSTRRSAAGQLPGAASPSR